MGLQSNECNRHPNRITTKQGNCFHEVWEGLFRLFPVGANAEGKSRNDRSGKRPEVCGSRPEFRHSGRPNPSRISAANCSRKLATWDCWLLTKLRTERCSAIDREVTVFVQRFDCAKCGQSARTIGDYPLTTVPIPKALPFESCRWLNPRKRPLRASENCMVDFSSSLEWSLSVQHARSSLVNRTATFSFRQDQNKFHQYQ